jgi:hypothetical protein
MPTSNNTFHPTLGPAFAARPQVNATVDMTSTVEGHDDGGPRVPSASGFMGVVVARAIGRDGARNGDG